MFTVSSNVLRCSFKVAEKVAKEAGLALAVATREYKLEHDLFHRGFVDTAKHVLWQDRQLGGGACRIVWRDGIAWVSRHSGYAYADLTEEAIFFLEAYGATPVTRGGTTVPRNPHIYGDNDPSWPDPNEGRW